MASANGMSSTQDDQNTWKMAIIFYKYISYIKDVVIVSSAPLLEDVPCPHVPQAAPRKDMWPCTPRRHSQWEPQNSERGQARVQESFFN
jgi:hypothetical protein